MALARVSPLPRKVASVACVFCWTPRLVVEVVFAVGTELSRYAYTVCSGPSWKVCLLGESIKVQMLLPGVEFWLLRSTTQMPCLLRENQVICPSWFLIMTLMDA